MADDAIRDWMRLTAELVPVERHHELRQLERRLRDIWGGQRVYLLKATAEGKAYGLGARLAAGASFAEAAQTERIPRRTAYRLLGRRAWVYGFR